MESRKVIKGKLMELTIVIPAYNEESSIKDTIKNIKKNAPGSEIIVVDDGSKDTTKERAIKEKVKVIVHPKNRGYGEALKTGMRAVRTKYVAFLDADMTYNPAYFPVMLSILKKQNLDCVWGNRFGGGKNRMPLIRKVGNKIITLFFFIITGKNIYDASSGQRIIKTNALKKIDFKSLPADLDVITALSKRIVSRRLKYRTVPINYEKREGRSKLGILKHGYKMMKNILLEK